MREIICFGNSHVHYVLKGRFKGDEWFTHEIDGLKFRGLQTGNTGATVYGLQNENSRTEARKKILEFLDKESPKELFLAFGEVDVREHIRKRKDGNLWLEMLRVIDLYIDFLIDLDVPRIHVMGTVPYSRSFVEKRENDPYYRYAPFMWNSMLANELLRMPNEFNFVDVCKNIITNDCTVKEEFLSDKNNGNEVHLKFSAIENLIAQQIKDNP